MKIIMNVFNFFIDAGPTVMLPVIITIIGLIFGLKITRAFKSGLTLGIGFAGIKLILDFMTTNVEFRLRRLWLNGPVLSWMRWMSVGVQSPQLRGHHPSFQS